MLTHRLSKPADDWFLKRGMRDPFVYKDFEEGDEVVVCGECRQVFLADCWDVGEKGCPLCHAIYTVPFSKQMLQHGKGATIKITGTVDAQYRSGGAAGQRRRVSLVQRFDGVVEALARLLCRRAKPILTVLLSLALFCSITLQIVSVLLFDASFQQFSDGFDRTQWAGTTSIEEIVQSMSDFLDQTDRLSDRLVQSGSDGIERAGTSVDRPLPAYLPR